jgi:hypothetical protein
MNAGQWGMAAAAQRQSPPPFQRGCLRAFKPNCEYLCRHARCSAAYWGITNLRPLLIIWENDVRFCHRFAVNLNTQITSMDALF